MKLIYGKGECVLNYSTEIVESVVIKYKGSIRLIHKHMEIEHFLGGNRVLIKRKSARSLIIHGNNQIHIGYLNNAEFNPNIFQYNGDFKIISAKVNEKNIPIEVTNVDYWNLIDSTWDNAGKPENYKGNYKVGRIPKKKSNKFKNIKRITKGSGGGY
tara:strand:- start:242 stop:712 length:471 start_codon:yes stop_codon:yes gene_type:complete